MSALTRGGFVGGWVLAFLAFAAFWAKSGELRAKRQRKNARRMRCERLSSQIYSQVSDLPLKLPLHDVSRHGHFVVVAEAEVFFGLGADEARAAGGDGGVLIELEGELAFFAKGGGDAVGLVVGGVVGLGGGEGFAVADGPDEFAAAEMERVAGAGTAVGDEDGIALRGGDFAGKGEGPVGDLRGFVGVDFVAGLELGEVGGLGIGLCLGSRTFLGLVARRIQRDGVFDLAGRAAGFGLVAADLGDHLFGDGGELRNDVGMLGGEVGLFADVLIEVVEAWVLFCIVGGFFAHGFFLRSERELPWALAHGLEVVAGEVVVGFAWRVFALAKEQRGEIATVDDGLRGHFGSGDFQAGGQHIDGAGDGIAHAAGRDFAGPPRECWDTHAAFPGAAFAAAQGAGAAAIGAFDEPGAVVTGENDECVLVELHLVQRVEHTTDAGIDFLHPVAKAAVLRAALEGFAGMDGRVHGGVREVEEEGPIFAAADELHGLVGIDFLDAILVRLIKQAFHLIIAHKRNDAATVHARCFEHVIGIRDAEVAIKALLRR